MNKLSIDIETFSSVDLKSAGVNRYVESADFEILLFAYKEDDKPVKVIDLACRESFPTDIFNALFDPNVLKTAFNATFEITCINQWLKGTGRKLDPRQWEDTMFRAAYAGYNGSLKSVAEMLGFEEDKQKDRSGTLLINKFSKPRKPTKRDQRTRVRPYDDPAAWKQFIEYNKQDVEVESAIYDALSDIEIPENERRAWILNFEIQARGIKVDTELVNAALKLDKLEKERLSRFIQSLTGIANPKSGAQIKKWFFEKNGYEIDSLTKDTVPDLIDYFREIGLSTGADVLEARQELMKTSLAKYAKLATMTCQDERIHELLQFYGTKTGRWAGRGVQVQNLPRNSLPDINLARELLKNENWDGLRIIYDPNLSNIASQLIRTVFIPSDGKLFAVADYSAIEARVIAWLSGEKWRLEVFKTTGKIYEASASQMFNVDFEKICDKNAPEHALRAQGKVAELALGYQGSIGALARMDYNNAIPQKDRQRIVKQWREKSPNIVNLWSECEKAAFIALKNPNQSFKVADGKLVFTCLSSNTLQITLPSGRNLYYPKIKLTINNYGKEAISYLGVNQTSKKIGYIETYGGKLVENIVQAIARDCLSEALLRLNALGYDIKFHVHDEVIIEIDSDNPTEELKKIISVMCETPKWANELPLNAEGFVSEFYMKN